MSFIAILVCVTGLIAFCALLAASLTNIHSITLRVVILSIAISGLLYVLLNYVEV